MYKNSDCGYDDVSGSCSGVEECKAICLNTTACGGFNTNGHLKKTDCLTHKASSSVDLYVLEYLPQ